jgi:hypothetical protein
MWFLGGEGFGPHLDILEEERLLVDDDYGQGGHARRSRDQPLESG